jgi:hypothetical protein
VEDEMVLIIECVGQPTRLLAPPTCAVLDAATRDSLRAAGVKTATYTKASYDALLDHVNKALA